MPSKWQAIAQEVEPVQEQPQSKWGKIAQNIEGQDIATSDVDVNKELSWAETAKRAVSNLPKSSYNLAKDMAMAVWHPVETAKSVGNIALGAIEKIPGARYLTPGPAYDIAGKPNVREQAVDSVINFYSDRYGSVEGFKKALAEDPAGIVSDLASVLTGAGGSIKGVGAVSKAKALGRAGEIVAKVGAQLEPVNLAMLPFRASKKFIPKSWPGRLYESAAKFPPAAFSRLERLEMVNTALEQRIMPTYKGLIKLGDKVEDLNSQVVSLIDKAVNTGEKIKIKQLLKEFDRLKKEARFSGKPEDARRAVNNIRRQLIEANSTITEVPGTKKVVISGVTGPNGMPYMVDKPITKTKKTLKRLTPAEAQKLKQSIYRELEGYYSSVTDSNISVRAQKLIARNAKEAIELIVPEVKQLNEREGALLQLKKAIERAAPRIANRDLLSLGTTAKAAGGGVVFGKAGLAAGLALGLLDSQPVIKARLALLIQAMKEKGINVRMTPTLARLLTQQVGRDFGEPEEQ